MLPPAHIERIPLSGNQPNWQRLYQEGRVKFVGVPFTDEETARIARGETTAQKLRDEAFGIKETPKIKVEPKEEPKEEPKDEVKEALVKEAKELGIKAPHIMKVETLQKKIAIAKEDVTD